MSIPSLVPRNPMSTPCLALVVLLVGCGDSLEDRIARLGAGGEATERAKLELLIAKGEAVPALLQALEDPGFTAGRAELAEVLVDLMTRIDDDRVRSAFRPAATNSSIYSSSTPTNLPVPRLLTAASTSARVCIASA